MTPTLTQPPAAASPPNKGVAKKGKGSPGKKKKLKTPTRNDNKRKERIPILTVQAFPEPFQFEAYSFTFDANTDCFTYGVKKYLNGEYGDAKNQTFDDAQFMKFVYRRIPFSDNLESKNPGTDFWRCYFIRYPKEKESTVATRQEGLEALSEFVRDKRFSKYPPDAIVLHDATNVEHLPPLDAFFKNADIKTFFEEDFELEHLTPEFFIERGAEFASSLLRGPHFSEYARSLGYGATP
jgi:hypothetical protein